jgi:hypothetical protein
LSRFRGMKHVLMTLNYQLSSRSRQINLDHFWRLLAPFPIASVPNLGATPPHQTRTLLGTEQGYLIWQPEQNRRWTSLRAIGGNIDKSSVEEHSRVY